MINLFGEKIFTDTKVCKTCEKELPLENFEPNRKFYDPTSSEKYRSLRRPSCISCRSTKIPIDKVAKKSYPKPPAEFNCPICHATVLAKDARLDHCHETGTIRGYLCNGCNTALGSFKDSVSVLNRAIVWLNKIKKEESKIWEWK